MRDVVPTTKPSLLFLAHCIPAPTGNPARIRAWQLLHAAARSHSVWLACGLDTRVRLTNWDDLEHLVHRIAIEPPLAVTARIRSVVRSWQRHQRFDAVICNHSSLWSIATDLDLPVSICDLDTPAAATRPDDNQTLLGHWTRHRHDRAQLTDYTVASEADAFLIAHDRYRSYFGVLADRAIVLPHALDLQSAAWRRPVQVMTLRTMINPTVFLHLHDSSQREAVRWFRSNVWPNIQSQIPGARIKISHVETGAKELADADLIVCPFHNPTLGRLAILQALASERPLVTHTRAVAGLSLRHGEHLLLADKESDWTQTCLSALKCRTTSTKLAMAGRHWLDTQDPFAQTDHLLDTLLQNDNRRRTHTLHFAA